MENLDLIDLTELLKSRWKSFLMAFVLTIAATYALYSIVPRLYESSALLRIESKRGEGALQPEGIAIFMTGASKDIISHVTMMKGRSVLEKVVKESGYLEYMLKNNPDLRERDENELIEIAVRRLKKYLEIEAVPNTNLISVSFRSPDPNLAFKVVKSLIRVYVGFIDSLVRKSVNLEREFLGSQLEILERKMRDSLIELVKYKKSTGIFSIEDEIESLTEKLKEIEVELERNRALMESLKVDTAEKLERFKNVPDTVDSSVLSQLEMYLIKLKAELDGYKSEYPPNHPEVRALETEVKSLENRIESLKRSSESEIETKEFLKEILMESIRSLDEIERRITELEKAKKMISERMDYLADHETEYVELKSRYSLLSNVYTFLSKKYEETLLKEASTVSPLTTVDGPNMPSVPIWPSRIIFLGVGGILGVVLGFVVVVLREIYDPRMSRIFLKHMDIDDYHVLRERSLDRDVRELAMKLCRFRGSICVIGPTEGEGKSFLASKLSSELSNIGLKIAFVDLDPKDRKILSEKIDLFVPSSLDDIPKLENYEIVVYDTPSIELDPIAHYFKGNADLFLIVLGLGISKRSLGVELVREFKPNFVVVTRAR